MSSTITQTNITVNGVDLKSALLDIIYPVGVLYFTIDANFDPNTSWGGTWVKVYASDNLYPVTSSGSFTPGTTKSRHWQYTSSTVSALRYELKGRYWRRTA